MWKHQIHISICSRSHKKDTSIDYHIVQLVVIRHVRAWIIAPETIPFEIYVRE